MFMFYDKNERVNINHIWFSVKDIVVARIQLFSIGECSTNR